MSRSNFSLSGLNIGENNTNMTYLYGISDFFSVMFEDTSKVNLLLESEAEVASAAYSKFLQLTSQISLQDIQTTLGQTLKLITIKSTDAILGEMNLYKLSDKIIDTRYVANKPLLPTTLLEQGVDYRIEKVNGESRIRFARDITNAGFSTRLLSDETTKEYALWFVDTEIDEGWISTNYASLIGVNPETSTEVFKNFVQGLYYTYLNGPTLELLRKGLNLCLGVPLARDVETVIDVRKYLETDQYIVVTDLNQYLIPYGLTPNVVADDILRIGDELAQWVEIKDYLHDGDWWLNLKIPEKMIPSLPEGQPDRYAARGTHFDYLMRNYLKKHTFLVNVKVTDFKNNQVFQQISDIIHKAKPSYTESIYIWTVPNTETIDATDERFFQRRDHIRSENLTTGIEQFFRKNTINPASRSNPSFIRYNVPNFINRLCGTDEYSNGHPFGFGQATVNGFVNPNYQFRDNTPEEQGWIRALKNRGDELLTTRRDKLGFLRNAAPIEDVSGTPVHHMHKRLKISPNMRFVPLYITTQADLHAKCDDVGVYTPDISEWCFDIFNPLNDSDSIDSLAVDEGRLDEFPTLLKRFFYTFNQRLPETTYLSSLIPEVGFNQFLFDYWDLTDADYLVGVRIHDDIIGMYLVTASNPISTGMYSVVEEVDALTMTLSTAPTRALGLTTSSYYLIRGATNLDYNMSEPHIVFSDSINPTPVIRSRLGNTITHMTELK